MTVKTDARKRSQVLSGAPDVLSSGGARVGKVATGETTPTDATTELNAGLAAKTVGFIGKDGVSKTVDRKTEKIKDWNGDTVIVLSDEHDVKLKTVFLEAANIDVLKAVFGEENMKEDDGNITLLDNALDLPHRSFCFEIKGNANRKLRVFVPDGQITSVGEQKFVRNQPIQFEVEIECFADEKGNKLYTFISKDTTPASDAS